MQGGLPQQTGVIIQPQQLVLASGNKVQGNQQVLDIGIHIILKTVQFCVYQDQSTIDDDALVYSLCAPSFRLFILIQDWPIYSLCR